MRIGPMASLLLGCSLFAADYSSLIESPNASTIIQKDLLAPAKTYTMPADCISTDPKVIARGAFMFHNLNGETKDTPPEGLSNKNSNGSVKQFGNCIACHNIEGAKGAGNIGPDLHEYKKHFIDSGARNDQFVYQKIADARIDNPVTHMTINLTSGLFNQREICDIASYVVSPK